MKLFENYSRIILIDIMLIPTYLLNNFGNYIAHVYPTGIKLKRVSPCFGHRVLKKIIDKISASCLYK